MLGQYGPDVLEQCETALSLSRELVGTWLTAYMFAGRRDRNRRARSVSGWLSRHTTFKSHGRHLSRGALQERGLVVSPLEDDEELQDLSLSVFHATTHTFTGTTAAKIVENHVGRAFIKHARPQQAPSLQIGIGPGPTQPPAVRPPRP